VGFILQGLAPAEQRVVHHQAVLQHLVVVREQGGEAEGNGEQACRLRRQIQPRGIGAAYDRGEPIEAALARRTGFFVPRERIVEIGSLACRNAAGAIAIVRALVPHLLHSGFTWVVFTGADTVMNVFRYLGLSPRELCRADPALLGAARHEWGSYYDHDPHVMAGRIEDGLRARPGKMQ